MTNLAKDARLAVQNSHPGASVHSRGKRWIKHQDVINPNRFIVDSHIGPIHYGVGEDQEIDTAWIPDTTDGFTHAMLANDFITRVRSDQFNAGNIFRFEKDGEWLAFDPQSINWIDENTSRQQIAIKQNVSGIFDDDVVSFLDAYGSGIDFLYRNETARLQKLITIDSLTSLPTPTVLGNAVWFEAEFSMALSSGIDFWIDGVKWDRGNNERIQTPNRIEVRDGTGSEVLWWLGYPRAFDSGDSETIGQLEVRRQGGPSSLFITVRIPYSWMQTATYPVFIDPTVDTQVGASADDAREAGNTVMSTTITEYTSNSSGERAASRWALAIPNAATIDVAYIQWYVSSSATFGHLISVEDEDTAAAYAVVNADISGRTYESNTVSWSGAGTTDAFNTSPSLVTPIQNVIDRAGWASGNYLGAQVNYNGSGGVRFVFYDSSTSNAPKIHIEYSTSTADELTADGIEGATELGKPSIGQTHILTSTGLEGATELGKPTLGQTHILASTGLEAATEVGKPTIAQTHILNSTGLEGSTELGVPTASQASGLVALGLEGSVELGSPSLGQTHILNSTGLEGSAELGSPIVGQTHILNSTGLEASVELGVPSLGQTHSLLATGLEGAVELGIPSLGQTHILNSTGLEGAAEVGKPTVGQTHILNSTGLEGATELGKPTLEEILSWGSLVQSKSGMVPNGARESSIAVTFDSTPTEGNLLIAAHYTGDGYASPPTGWTAAFKLTQPVNDDDGGLYYKIAGSSESSTVTATCNTVSEHTLIIAEFQGPWHSSPLDVEDHDSYATGDDARSLGPTSTLDQAENLVVGVAAGRLEAGEPVLSGGGFTTGFTEVDIFESTNKWVDLDYKTIDSSAAQSAEWDATEYYNEGHHAGIAVFKKAGTDALAADGLVSDTELGKPALAQTHVLAASGLEIGSELDESSIGQTHILDSNGLSVVSELGSPVGGIIFHLQGNSLEIGSAVGAPAIGQTHILSSIGVKTQTILRLPTLEEIPGLISNSLKVSSVLDQPTIGQIHTLISADVKTVGEIGIPIVGKVDVLGGVGIRSETNLEAPWLAIGLVEGALSITCRVVSVVAVLADDP